jgi:hypothetical protein
VTIGSTDKNNPTYAVAIDLSPVGASIDSVTLNAYKRTVNEADPYTFQRPYVGFEAQSRPLATRWISVDGKRVDLDAVPWALQSSSRGLRSTRSDLADASGPTLRS